MFAGDPDVPPFGIKNHNQASFAGMQGQLVAHRDAVWAKSFVTSRLNFDRGHEIGQLIDDPQTKVLDDLEIIPSGQAIADWVNPDTQGSTGAADRGFKQCWFWHGNLDATPGR